MRIFVTIIMFVVIPFLCVAEDLPNPTPSPSVGSQTEKQHEGGTHQEKSRDDSPPNQPLSVIDGAKSSSSEKISSNKGNNTTHPSTHNDSNQAQALTNWLVMIFTGILAAAAVVQLFIYARQAHYMGQQLELTRQSVNAAQDSANAAMKTAIVTEEALKLTERVYLTIGHWRWSRPEAAHPGTISFFLTNTGRTPARLFGYFIERCVDRRPSTITSEYRQRLTAGRQALMIAAQERQEVPVDQNDLLPPVQWQQIRDGAIPLYVFAHIEYDDVFEERYEVGCLVRYDRNAREFRMHANTAYNYNRKKNNQ